MTSINIINILDFNMEKIKSEPGLIYKTRRHPSKAISIDLEDLLVKWKPTKVKDVLRKNSSFKIWSSITVSIKETKPTVTVIIYIK